MSDPATGKAMTSTRLIEMEMAANAHPGNRSAAMILELVEAVRELQKRKAKRAAFTPPTVEELTGFFAEGEVFKNGSAKEMAELFHDHYTANSWKVGRVPMVDWRAAARGWEARARQKATAGPALNRQVATPRL